MSGKQCQEIRHEKVRKGLRVAFQQNEDQVTVKSELAEKTQTAFPRQFVEELSEEENSKDKRNVDDKELDIVDEKLPAILLNFIIRCSCFMGFSIQLRENEIKAKDGIEVCLRKKIPLDFFKITNFSKEFFYWSSILPVVVHVKPQVIEIDKKGESTAEKFANAGNFRNFRNDGVRDGEIK